MKKYYVSSGFTLIELMVTVAIVAILLLAAAPDLTSTIQRNRIHTYQADLVGDIAFARQEAIRLSSPVTICGSPDGLVCNAANDWASGRMSFVDELGSVVSILDGNDELLRVSEPAGTNDRVQSTDNYFQFDSRGWLVLPVGSPRTEVIITICSQDDSDIRGVRIMASGRVIASREDANGDTLVINGVLLACV